MGSALLLLLTAGCSSTEFFIANVPSRFTHVISVTDIRYGADARQKMDIYRPRGVDGAPVVIFWYGGTWDSGSKSDYRFVGVELANLGFIAVVPDYRLYPQVTFPSFEEDGANAVFWVQAHVQEFGGDPHRIVLMGHSAGAHTAAFLAFNHAFLERFGVYHRNIVGLVGLSGPYALVPDSTELRAEFPPPYTVADWQPIRFVDSEAPPTLLVHGLGDEDVSPSQSIELHDALVAAHVRVDMDLYAHRGHAATVAAFSKVLRWRTPVVKAVDVFIRSVTGRPKP